MRFFSFCTALAFAGVLNVSGLQSVPAASAGQGYTLTIYALDRNFVGQPKEQWGLSNDPHAVIKTPSYKSCTFQLKGDQEIHVKMQQ
jgi:uncharacterized protein (DUF2141 family)